MHRGLLFGLVGLVVLALLIWGVVRALARQADMLKAQEDQVAQLGAMARMLERIAIAQENRAK